MMFAILLNKLYCKPKDIFYPKSKYQSNVRRVRKRTTLVQITVHPLVKIQALRLFIT